MAASPRLALTFVFATVALDANGIGLIFPVMPDLIREVTGGTLSDAALWGRVRSTSFAVMQFLPFGPVICSPGNRYGRRPVLLLSLAVMSLDCLVLALAPAIRLLLAGIDTRAPFRAAAGLAAANMVFGLTVNMVKLAAMAAVTSGAVALVPIPLTVLSGVTSPALQSIPSRQTAADAQGALQGVLSSVSAIAMIAAPPLITGTFAALAAFTAHGAPPHAPGAPFLLSALPLVAAILLHVAGTRAIPPAVP